MTTVYTCNATQWPKNVALGIRCKCTISFIYFILFFLNFVLNTFPFIIQLIRVAIVGMQNKVISFVLFICILYFVYLILYRLYLQHLDFPKRVEICFACIYQTKQQRLDNVWSLQPIPADSEQEKLLFERITSVTEIANSFR